ncbi:MAG: type III polyketide synthase [Spirochaetales bacterium]
MPEQNTRVRAAMYTIGTSVPRSSYTQDQALSFMKSVPGYNETDRAFLDRIYPSSAIGTRHSVIEDWEREPADFTFFSQTEDMLPEPTLRQRNDIFASEAHRIATEAAQNAFGECPGVGPSDITHVITVSCTGFTAPGLDYQVIRALDLNPKVDRFHLGFMGCFAAYPALKMADSFVRSDPNARVLVICLELCSLHFQFKQDRETMVANSLFADGAAAAIVGAADRDDDPGTGYRMDGFASELLDDSQSAMAWTIGDVAFDMKLSVYVPKIVQKNIAAIVDRLSASVERTRDDINAWAVHPGGRAVLERVCRGLDLNEEDLWASFDVLHDYGNMSSPTILFVLKHLLEDDSRGVATGSSVFSAAFGPGLTVESAFLTARKPAHRRP